MQATILFDKEFTADLDESGSSAFRELESSVNTVVSLIPTGRLFYTAFFFLKKKCVLTSRPRPASLLSCAASLVESRGLTTPTSQDSGTLAPPHVSS